MFKLNLSIPFSVVMILMSLFSVFTVVYVQEESIHKNKENVSHEFLKDLDEKVDIEAAILGEYMDFIQTRADIAEAFKTLDKKGLNVLIKKIYARLNKNVNLTHLYFIEPNGKVLLRVHDYDRDRDVIKRSTFLQAQKKQSLFYGLEFGPKKNYTLRVVKPWFVDGELIGYLELGKEIDRLIKDLSHALKTEIYLAVDKSVYKNANPYVKRQLAKKRETKEHYVVYNTFDVPDEMEAILDGTKLHMDIELSGGEYFTSKEILSDVSGKELGYFVFLSDITLEHSIMYSSAKALVFILSLVSIVLITGGYFTLKNREKKIFNLTSKLENQKADLASYNDKLQNLFNLQKNIVIITNGVKMMMANQAMFDFFGYEDLDAFSSQHNCVCDRFVENSDFFHLKKILGDKNWIETMMTLPEEERVVAMIDKELISHAFSVSIGEFEESNHIISFTDISQTIIQSNRLKRKATHDKLTGAYNREYFDTHVQEIIEEAQPKTLGLVICDIDHFKLVNDTYGHNRGDAILQEFTKLIKNVIRESDYLVRWGGEEFIILMRVSDIDSLKNVSEKVRSSIEKHHFEEAQKITASFGLTVYVKGENIINAIARMDKALYMAKKSGRNQCRVLLDS